MALGWAPVSPGIGGYAAETGSELSCRGPAGTNGCPRPSRPSPSLPFFPLDRSRVAYLRYLRRRRRQSPRSEADADHVRVKTEMLQLGLMEKKRELLRRLGFR